MKLEDVILLGDRASQPASNTVPIGTLYAVTDEDNIVERNNGTTWDAYSPTGGGGGAPDTATYLTENDETGDLPNSRALLAGTNITFDDSTPGERTVNASGGGGGAVLEVEVDLTNAEILTLNSNIIELVAAPAAGFGYIPIAVIFNANFGAGAYSSFVMTVGIGSLEIDSPAYTDTVDVTYVPGAGFSDLPGNIANSPILLYAAADPTGGNAANTGRVRVLYILMELAGS